MQTTRRPTRRQKASAGGSRGRRRTPALISATAVLLTVGACGSAEEQPTDGTPPPAEQATDDVTEEPTEQPTEEPTEQPTEEPTDQPTEEPTEEPTDEPTDEPTGGAGDGEIIELRDGTIGGVDLPAPPEEVKEVLVAAWGEPDTEGERPGCPLEDPDTQLYEMVWGDLTVYGEYPPDQDRQIDVWKISGVDFPENTDTPFDIIPGTPWDVAEGAIPGVRQDVFLDGSPWLFTDEREGMRWLGDEDETEIVNVAYNEGSCD